MFNSYWKSDETENERYLRMDLEDAQERVRQLEQQQEEDRNQRMREYKEMRYYSQREASSWPDALQKQSRLYWDEYIQFCNDEWSDPEEEDFFAQGSKACQRALEIWADEYNRAKPEIDKLKQRVEKLEKLVRLNTGLQLKLEKPETDKNKGWERVADELMAEDSDPSEWLKW